MTVETLRERIGETTSPEHIKAEVKTYISHKTSGWLDQLKQQAMENPLQALAAGTAAALPLLRLARAVPLPMMLIGAGVALSSSKVRNRASELLGPHLETVKDYSGQIIDKARSAASDAQDATSDLAERTKQSVQEARDAAASKFEEMRGRATDAAANLQPHIDHIVQRASEVKDKASDFTATAPDAAGAFVKDNAVLIGGLGLVIGAVIAASLSPTEVEAKTVSGAAAKARRMTNAAAHSAFCQ